MTMKTLYDEDCYVSVNASFRCPQAVYAEIRSWVQGYASARRAPTISMVEPLSGARRQIQVHDDGVLESPEGSDLKDISWNLPLKNGSNQSKAVDDYESIIGMGVIATTSSHWMVAIFGLFYNWAKNTDLGLVNRVLTLGFKSVTSFL